MARRVALRALEEHPNLEEIVGVLAELPHITDPQLVLLASTWRNTVSVAEARRKALSPDSPLIIEVLSAFDAIAGLYGADLDPHSDERTLAVEVTLVALKAVRDAIAATYARPVLSRSEYCALMAAWRRVFPRALRVEPDLGPAAGRIKGMLGVLPQLAGRCHDVHGQRAYDGLLVSALTADRCEQDAARAAVRTAALLTGRRRLHALVERNVAESLHRRCPQCRPAPRGLVEAERDAERVLELCVAAAGALLVSDCLDEGTTRLLTAPLAALIPVPRSSAGS